jgi:hypothetical protein
MAVDGPTAAARPASASSNEDIRKTPLPLRKELGQSIDRAPEKWDRLLRDVAKFQKECNGPDRRVGPAAGPLVKAGELREAHRAPAPSTAPPQQGKAQKPQAAPQGKQPTVELPEVVIDPNSDSFDKDDGAYVFGEDHVRRGDYVPDLPYEPRRGGPIKL